MCNATSPSHGSSGHQFDATAPTVPYFDEDACVPDPEPVPTSEAHGGGYIESKSSGTRASLPCVAPKVATAEAYENEDGSDGTTSLEEIASAVSKLECLLLLEITPTT